MAAESQGKLDIADSLEEEAVLKAWRGRLQDLSSKLEELESEVRKEEEEEEGEEKLGGVEGTKFRLTKLADTVSSMESDLLKLMDTPRLRQMLDAEEDTPTCVAAIEVFGLSQKLQLSAQDYGRRLEKLATSLQGRNQKKDTVLRDFENLEAWLQQAYDAIFREPSRHLYPPSLVDEDILRTFSQSSICAEAEGEGTSRTTSAQNGSAAVDADGEGGTSEGAVVVEQGTGEDGSGHSNGRPPEGEEEGTEDGSGKEAGQGGGSGDSEDISPTESGDTEEGEGVSSEWTQSSSEVESLGWIRGLHILPIVHIVPHLPTPPPSSPSSTSTSSSLWDATRGSAADGDLDQLLAELEKFSRELPIQSQKMKKVKANVFLAVSSLPTESAEEYHTRQVLLQARWDMLEAELKTRMAELGFEKEQKNILESMHEAVSELEQQPLTNMLPDVVEEKYTDLMDFIISVEQFEAMKTDQLRSLDEALETLEGRYSEASVGEKWREVADNIVQAYEALAKRVREQKSFLERCRLLWNSFEKCYNGCCVWLDRAERLVSKETYGYTLKETQAHLTEIRDLKQTIQVVEEKGAELVSLGKTMQVGIDEGSDAEQYVDKRLSEVESHMEGLVTPTKGKIEATETDVDKIADFDHHHAHLILTGVARNSGADRGLCHNSGF